MRCKPPDSRFLEDLEDLNAIFLGLITDESLHWQGSIFGLDAGIVAALRALTPAEIRFIAATPCPLARFPNLPPANRVAESPARLSPLDERWREAVKTFATGLLVYLWQVAQHDPLAARLCLGPADHQAAALASMGFGDIRKFAAVAADDLEARLGGHPRFWPHLIRAARGRAGDYGPLSRIAAIPLVVAESLACDKD